MNPLAGAMLLVAAFLLVLSGFYAQRAESARAQYACTGLALYELRRGRPERSAAYLRAAHVAYITGHCDPALSLEIEVAR
ncbi:hypothetical protein [Phenylobacterium sp.]|uniref:hypothetical protein n=1 Tax=Phenylobacterium sp. TaxID=1871053 RepID=UPI0035AD7CA7